VKFRDLAKGEVFFWRNRWWRKTVHGGDTVQGPGTGGAQDQHGNFRIFGNETPIERPPLAEKGKA